jgi:hypothetical protein
VVAFVVFFSTRAVPLIHFGNGKKKYVLLIPLYVAYQFFLQILLFYLVVANVTRIGITVRYGGRDLKTV